MIQSSPLAIIGEGAFSICWAFGPSFPLWGCWRLSGGFLHLGNTGTPPSPFSPLTAAHSPPQPDRKRNEASRHHRTAQKSAVFRGRDKEKIFFQIFLYQKPADTRRFISFYIFFYFLFYLLYCVAVPIATKLHRSNDRTTPTCDKTTPVLRQNYTHKMWYLTEHPDHKPPAAAAPELQFYCDKLTPNCDKLT